LVASTYSRSKPAAGKGKTRGALEGRYPDNRKERGRRKDTTGGGLGGNGAVYDGEGTSLKGWDEGNKMEGRKKTFPCR